MTLFLQTSAHADSEPYHVQRADSVAVMGAQLMATGILAGKPKATTELCALVYSGYKSSQGLRTLLRNDHLGRLLQERRGRARVGLDRDRERSCRYGRPHVAQHKFAIGYRRRPGPHRLRCRAPFQSICKTAAVAKRGHETLACGVTSLHSAATNRKLDYGAQINPRRIARNAASYFVPQPSFRIARCKRSVAWRSVIDISMPISHEVLPSIDQRRTSSS